MITHYIPKHFMLQELVPRETYRDHGQRAWKFLNPLALWTLDALREEYGPVIVNDWIWDGQWSYRGYRPAGCKVGAKDSAHRHGNAFDCNFKGFDAERVRQDLFMSVKKNVPPKECFKYITEVETGISWFHFAVTNHNRDADGIFVFGKS